RRDYWDDPSAAAGHEDEAVAVTSPDTSTDHPATEPDMFGTGKRTGEETAEMPAARAESQPGAATIADVPAARTPVGESPPSAAPVTETPAGDVAAPADAEATPDEAAATPGNGELRPGEAADPGLRPGETAGKLGDF